MSKGVSEMIDLVDAFFDLTEKIKKAKEDGRVSTFEKVGVGFTAANAIKKIDFDLLWDQVEDITGEELIDVTEHIEKRLGTSDLEDTKGFLRTVISMLK